MMQIIIVMKVQFCGVGLYLGVVVWFVILFVLVDYGIVFSCSDFGGVCILVCWDQVMFLQLCMLMDNGDGVMLLIVEYVMVVLVGIGINNVLVEVNGLEVLIFDGLFVFFVLGIMEVGICYQDVLLCVICVLCLVEVQQGEVFVCLLFVDYLQIYFDIDFIDVVIGYQEKWLDMVNGSFVYELMDSCIFCCQVDVVQMQKNGLVFGGIYLNVVVVDGDKVLLFGGLCYKDEVVCYKMLDVMGDLVLVGVLLLVCYIGYCVGYVMINKLLWVFFVVLDVWEWVIVMLEMQQYLLGVGVVFVDMWVMYQFVVV